MTHHARARHLSFAVLGAALLVATACQPQAAPGASPTTAPTAAATAAPSEPKTLVFGTATASAGGCDGTQLVQYAITLSCPGATQEAFGRFDWATNTVKPALALSWTEAPDSVTFKLRPNVKFHDGTPFNADAAVFNIRRVFDKTFAANTGFTFPYAFYVPFKGVEKVDDMAVKVSITPTPMSATPPPNAATILPSCSERSETNSNPWPTTSAPTTAAITPVRMIQGNRCRGRPSLKFSE